MLIAALLSALILVWLSTRRSDSYMDQVHAVRNRFDKVTKFPVTQFRMTGRVLEVHDGSVDVTAACTYRQILARGVYPAVVADHNLDLSVGAAVSSLVAGFGSHKHGFAHDCVLDADVLMADGSVLPCSERVNAQLFRSLPHSGGAFGRILRLRLRTVPYKRRVELVPAEENYDYATVGADGQTKGWVVRDVDVGGTVNILDHVSRNDSVLAALSRPLLERWNLYGGPRDTGEYYVLPLRDLPKGVDMEVTVVRNAAARSLVEGGGPFAYVRVAKGTAMRGARAVLWRGGKTATEEPSLYVSSSLWPIKPRARAYADLKREYDPESRFVSAVR
jgi:FAD/FMN-containing dehydrogenase